MQKTSEVGIYRLDDGRWRVRVTAKDPKTGKYPDKTRTLGKHLSLEDAVIIREELREILRQQLEETEQKPSLGPEIITLADYAELWTERKGRKWRRSTAKKNTRVLSYHILPLLGHVRLDALTRRDVSRWIAWAEGQTMDDGRLYAAATVKSWWRVFRNILRDAFAQGFTSQDITMRHSPPDTGVYNRQEKRTLTAEQLRQLVDAAKRLQPQRYAEIATLAYTGMRVGELYGLHWSYIDIAERTIHICQTAWKAEVGPTKTGSTRTVPIVDLVADALEDHRAYQMRQQVRGLGEGIVFPSTKGTYRHTESLRKPLNLLVEHLGFDITVSPQVLRRTFNTLLVAAKVDRITIRSMTGHSSERMTEHYAGIPTAMKRQAVDSALGTLAVVPKSTCGDGAGGPGDPGE